MMIRLHSVNWMKARYDHVWIETSNITLIREWRTHFDIFMNDSGNIRLRVSKCDSNKKALGLYD